MAVPPTDANGGLRSYGSMTYAGLKSMIYAGLKPDDPRVKAATDYIAKHYTLEENPGMGQAGLFYYYQTFAKALSLIGKHEIVPTPSRPVGHFWKLELVDALTRRQGPTTEAGSTPPTASWKETPTSSRPTACWLWPIRTISVK